MEKARDERVRQVAVGVGILIVLMLLVTGLLVGWRYLPGLLGEWIGTMVGLMTTPFILESSFLLIGLMTVISLNVWRRRKEGDEFVYLEQVDGPDMPADLPERSKWALYREKPLDGENPTLLAQAEGAFAIGDFPAAADWIGAMDSRELKQPETHKLRIELARATGRDDLARKLTEELP